MANGDTARIEENTAVPSCESEQPIPQDAHKSADRAHKTPSQKPGTARGNSAKLFGKSLNVGPRLAQFDQ
jgi:hypothetical protein